MHIKIIPYLIVTLLAKLIYSFIENFKFFRTIKLHLDTIEVTIMNLQATMDTKVRSLPEAIVALVLSEIEDSPHIVRNIIDKFKIWQISYH